MVSFKVLDLIVESFKIFKSNSSVKVKYFIIFKKILIGEKVSNIFDYFV